MILQTCIRYRGILGPKRETLEVSQRDLHKTKEADPEQRPYLLPHLFPWLCRISGSGDPIEDSSGTEENLVFL